MMTHSQLKIFITEAVLLLILGVGIVIGGNLLSSKNAYKRIQNEYYSRFNVVLDCSSYEKIKSKALNDFLRSKVFISVMMLPVFLKDM